MLLKIDVDPADIIKNDNGRIIIKIHHYGPFARAAHLVTTDGEKVEDYEKNRAKKSKTLFVGVNGGITLG